ncbi:hypothetical protein JX265_001199 [Neoarthrinium moseri]|uniref:Rhodopsin domain-containing protein n=1 Tax=Neoarthrinium moseri TaxID=1658444 RepID=A0A9Q0AW80_9PEZI|nr:uncharacterized protein JN550_007373 [Neoarthrinium moseri]KAI1866826.1 hypothetical protein JN550_007373 [Neoarthrinium moseri]KAI1880959.1 hypothetical protein JX265_001199 [Neoarthrinium moseri]
MGGGLLADEGTPTGPGLGLEPEPPGSGPLDNLTGSYVAPEGLAAVVLAFSVFFAVTSLLVVSLRLWIRGRTKILGLDDGLMAIGLLLFLADAGLASYATFQGLGMPFSKMNKGSITEGLKYVVIWQLFYVTSLVFIKNSICITLLRISVKGAHRWAIYVTIGVSTMVFLVALIGLITVCRPIQAQWEAGSGFCGPRSVTMALNYVISAGAIATDWACAVIPVLILWKAQMKSKSKVSIGIVLGLGSLASLSTFARLPYLRYYGDDDDYLEKVGNIVLWSVFEGGIGLIAGSLPMLRQLFKHWLGNTTRATPAGPSHVITVGGTSRKFSVSSIQKPHTQLRSKIQDDRYWDRLDNASVDSHQLHDVHEDSESQHELQELGRRDAAVAIRDLEKILA